MKFKIEKTSRGGGIISLEESIDKEKPLTLVIFRNKFGNVIFQGQLMKNVSKLTKKNPPKPYKIQRMFTVVGKKEGGQGLLKCTITFKSDPDCLQFKEAFIKTIAKLPEIIKAQKKDAKS